MQAQLVRGVNFADGSLFCMCSTAIQVSPLCSARCRKKRRRKQKTRRSKSTERATTALPTAATAKWQREEEQRQMTGD